MKSVDKKKKKSLVLIKVNGLCYLFNIKKVIKGELDPDLRGYEFSVFDYLIY